MVHGMNYNDVIKTWWAFGFSLPKYNTLNQLYTILNGCVGIISCKTNSSSEICVHQADYRLTDDVIENKIPHPTIPLT